MDIHQINIKIRIIQSVVKILLYYLNGDQNHQDRQQFLFRSMKKKPQISGLLDDLQHQDAKTRISSLQSLKDIAQALGPVRTRTQLLQYLQQFVDDEQQVVDQLLSQVSDFRAQLGGQEHQKQLLSLLICFCKTDQPKHTSKCLSLMQPILTKNKQLILDVIKKLSKTQMNTAKHAAAYLTSRLINLVPHQQSQLLEIFSGMVFSDVPAYKIIAAREIGALLEKIKNKEEIGKMLQVIYNDSDDLPKIFAMDALVNYFEVNNNFVNTKFKLMLAANNWRINAKICQVVPTCAKTFTKAAFKTTFQQPLLKFLSSNEAQLRAKSCCLLKPLALGMAEQQIKKNLIPVIKKLAADPIPYVKVAASQHIAPLIQVMSGTLINQQLLPLLFTFIKSNDLAVGILKNFQTLTKKFSSQIIQQKILTPLVTQLNTDDWKAKCSMIDLLTGVISNSFFLNDQLTTTLVHLAEDKIGAVREKATKLIINIITQQSPQWCDSMLIPKLLWLKDSPSYIERQIMLQIIEKTSQKVSQKTLSQVYRQTVINNLNDKVPNVRAKALKVLRNSKALNHKMFDKYVEKLKGDADSEVKRLAGEMGKFTV